MKSAQGARTLIFAEFVAHAGELQKCQNGACDLGLENKVEVQVSCNFNWPYTQALFTQNQNV